jgi:leucyl/phenylalanyl-tRNA---protein transferase
MSATDSVSIPWLDSGEPLPAPERAGGAETEVPGLLAASAAIELPRLIQAYRSGIFPWYNADQPVLWWSPNPRMVLQVADFRLHRSLRQHITQGLRSGHLEVRVDVDFEHVIHACANARRDGQRSTWIVPELTATYIALHRQGMAHSVETFWQGQRVGGLYAVNMGGMVYGESMYSEQTNASKVALAALVALCRRSGMPAIDCQQETQHLAFMGAQAMPRGDFLNLVRHAVERPAPAWKFSPDMWTHLDPRLGLAL